MISQLSVSGSGLVRVYSIGLWHHNSGLVIGRRIIMRYVLTIIVLLACVCAMAATTSQTVRCQEIAFSKSAEARDAEVFAAFIDADARFVGNSVARGPDAIVEKWSAFFAADGPEIKWRPRFVEVLVDGTLALTRGPYRVISSDEEGNRQESWGTFNSVWRLQTDGRWKVVFDTGNASDESPPDEIGDLLDADDACKAQQQ